MEIACKICGKEMSKGICDKCCIGCTFGDIDSFNVVVSELSEFQKEVGNWGDKTFNSKRNHDLKACSNGIYNHLMKEVRELYTAIYRKFFPDEQPVSSIAEETADCFLLLLHLSHLHKFDLLEESRKKMEINRVRKWGKPDKDGVIEHV